MTVRPYLELNLINYRPEIDGLRAVAVLSVLVNHVNSSLLSGGFLGVDIFFVISGYLISLIIFREQDAGTFRFSSFYARRIKRLFPALATVLVLVIGFAAFALFAEEFEQLGRHSVAAVLFFLNLRLMGEAGYFDVTADAKPLLHLWSLSVEEQFYVLWPVLLLATTKGFQQRRGALIFVLFFASFAFALYLAKTRLDALYFHPFARFWELLAGALIAWGHHRRNLFVTPLLLDSPSFRNALSLLGLAAVFGSFVVVDSSSPHPGPSAIFAVAGAAILIASGRMAWGNRVLALKPLVMIGLISYPLYLWHWPILSFIRIMESGAPHFWTLAAGVGIAFIFSAITYLYIELPVRRSASNRLVIKVLVGGMAAILLISLLVVDLKGVPDRPIVRYVQVAEAQLKREPRQDDSCMSRFVKDGAPVYCRQYLPGGKMVAVIGDSHAHVLFPGVAALASKQGYGTLLLANSGCPPFDGAVLGRNEVEKESCRKSIETILKNTETDKRVVAVVIASRGPQYLDGKGFGAVEAHYNYPPISASGTTTSPSDLSPEAVFSHGLATTVERVGRDGRQVAYVLQVPELGVSARDCLSRPLTLPGRDKNCEVDYAVFKTRMRSYRELIAGLQAANSALAVVDPAQVLCDGSKCYGNNGTELLYADDNHLSVLGSHRIAPLIFEALRLPLNVHALK